MMVRKLVEWAVNNPLIVILLAFALAGFGVYSFMNVNVEAYPDPAPAIIEVVAQFPGQTAEQVEQKVTVILETALAGMPGLTYTRSKSLFGLSHLRNQFDYGVDFEKAKQEVINRLQSAQQDLPPGVVPQLSPETPTGEIFRYTLRNAKDPSGRDVYTLNDLKALQDWVLEREFRRIPRIADVVSTGGTVKRYEIHPDPARLAAKGILMQQVKDTLNNSNANVGGALLTQGHIVLNVRSVGQLGGGRDPVVKVLALKDPIAASAKLREEEARRIREIRELVIASVNNFPTKIDDIVEGGPILQSPGAPLGEAGVVIGHQTRLGHISLSRPPDPDSPLAFKPKDEYGRPPWRDEYDKIQGIVLLRKGAESKPALLDIEAKVKELNETPGRFLPGVQIEPYYDRTELMNVTTETVQENLLVGMALVTVILLMFLSNIRSALIVAINIPLALLFAFSVLFLRGKSANLLSIGAVDFGIIVDSSVILVENIYRHVSSSEHAELRLKERILRACREVEKSLFFSTIIMVCALLPLFTMKGPEGQIFGPMADTYAFALGGALLLALTLSSVLCLLLFRTIKPARDNFLVRGIKRIYLGQLRLCLDHRWITLGLFLALAAATAYFALPGREFMPELEEGNLYIRATFPLNSSLERVSEDSARARAIIRSYPEVEAIIPQVGRPDDGTDPTGFYNVEIFVPLLAQSNWPDIMEAKGWRKFLTGNKALRPRTKDELIKEMGDELAAKLPGVDWNFSQNIRDNVMEALSGVKGDNSVKIFGPDLNELERLADQLKNVLKNVKGVESVGVFNIKGQSNLEFRVDPVKCARWGVRVADVNDVVETALGGKALSRMNEGEKSFDISLRWAPERRGSESSILDIPVDITNNQVVLGGTAVSPSGSSVASPAVVGTPINTANPITNTPHLTLRQLVSPLNDEGDSDPNGSFIRPGASTIYREQGQRLIAIKFSVNSQESDLASAVAEAKEKAQPLIPPSYRTEWSGEFQEMEEAEARLVKVFALAMVLILILLYLAFKSILDAGVVLAGVVGVGLGGLWALYFTGTYLNVSGAVGFISILGVAILNGLLLVSSFNAYRAQGLPLREALEKGVEKLIRPVTMTALAAIFGLLPAALSTRIGSQSQRPLAIVVVGGMIMTLLLTNLIPVLYSFYGHREPPAGAGGMAH
ncbi:MAG: efflux RND transporter permease subunit [Gemmataceae bacterium]